MNREQAHIGCLDGSTIGISRRGDDIVLSIEGTEARLSPDGARRLVKSLAPLINSRAKHLEIEHSPPNEKYSTWSERAKHYLDKDPIYTERYKKEKISIVERWVSYALNHNLNPGEQNQDAVDEFMRSKQFATATLNIYHRHLHEWFSLCRQFKW